MKSLEHLHTFDQLKILSDARRLSILKHLMSGPATLTQLGHLLGEHPAWIRHHLKLLETAGLVELGEVIISDGYIEKYYQAKANAFLLQELLLPEKSGKRLVVLSGSHDLAVELLSHSNFGDLDVFTLPVGSLDGLISLRQGMCTASGCHLFDPVAGDYNSPFVRHFFPDKTMLLITLAYREQGLMVAPGNPYHIHGIEDLIHNVPFINRNRGSGTRIWLDDQLNRTGISPDLVLGYHNEAYSHTEVAIAIQHGRAQVGLGIKAAAVSCHLDFVPLFEERYDLVMEKEQVSDRALSPLFDTFYSGKFRSDVQNLAGYDVSHLGEQIIL